MQIKKANKLFMDKIQQLNESQKITLSDDFYKLLNAGIIFNPSKSINYYQHDSKMSATIMVHLWNHSKFLSLLFDSFFQMNKDNIDLQIIITDSGSDDEEIKKVNDLMNSYKGIFKIDYIIHDLIKLREKFNDENKDGTFHGFPYISNSALNFCKGDILAICDSSNVVNDNWLMGLVVPHYKFFNSKLILKSRGADYTAESTLKLENEKKFSKDFLKLEHNYHHFEAGRGFGWSMKTKNLIELGGFRHLLSSCGGVDDDLIYRAKINGFQFIGTEASFAIHRIHNEGYEKNARKPNWAYRKLCELYIDNKSDTIINFESIKPIKHFKNYE